MPLLLGPGSYASLKKRWFQLDALLSSILLSFTIVCLLFEDLPATELYCTTVVHATGSHSIYGRFWGCAKRSVPELTTSGLGHGTGFEAEQRSPSARSTPARRFIWRWGAGQSASPSACWRRWRCPAAMAAAIQALYRPLPACANGRWHVPHACRCLLAATAAAQCQGFTCTACRLPARLPCWVGPGPGARPSAPSRLAAFADAGERYCINTAQAHLLGALC